MQKKIFFENIIKEFYLLFLSSFLFVIIIISYFLPQNKIQKAKLDAGRWPWRAKKQISLVKVFFENNQEQKAKQQLAFSKKILFLSPFNYKKIKQEIDNNKNILNQKKEIQEKITYWEEIIQNKPNYRDVSLYLSLLYYQIWEQQKAETYWKKAFWLDPNNSFIQKVGEIVNNN